MTAHPPAQIGRYRIESELGRGTMGVVYRAIDTTLGRTVALKTFSTMAAVAPHEREGFEQRFLSEARISATLDDKNVVAVYDVGRDFESGLLFMALEYVHGETLGSLLSQGPLKWMEASRIIAKVARALQIAHAHHIVHRDIKPANIMINQTGEPKIMDFGIAKASAAQLTVAGQVFGTPAYMSPEQASGEAVDGRSDIFSLGAVLYELVTDTRPFEGPTMATTLTKILRDEPVPASKLVDIPRALDSVIARALRKARDQRYDSASQLAEDLEAVIEGTPPVHAKQLTPLDTVALGQKPPRSDAGPNRTAPAPRVPIVSVDPETPATPSPMRLVAAVSLGVVLGVGVVLLLQRFETAPASRNAPNMTVRPGASTNEPVRPLPAPVPTAPAAPAPASDATPAPTAAVFSAQGSSAAARVRLDLTHPFGSGSLRVKVDDRVVLATGISGMPHKVLGMASGFEGHFGADLVIPPGEHVIRVEVRSGAAELIESKTIRLQSGEQKRLVALAGKVLTLTFE